MEILQTGANVPASRQKNCNGCVQGKRRCDRRTPICSRCAKKNIPCIYTRSKTPGQLMNQIARQSSGAAPLSNEHLICPLLASRQSLNLEPLEATPTDVRPYATIAARSESIPISSTTAAGIADDPMSLFTNWMSSGSMSPGHPLLVSFDQSPAFERPSSPLDMKNAMAYQKMGDFCNHIDPWHLHDPKALLHYVVGRVKGFSSEIADRNATPFLHRYLYKDHVPQCILSCFSINVLYTKRTRENTAMVMRALHNNVRELLDAETSRIMATPAQKLARAQALFMYQIIRLFDGDVFLRAQGERDMLLFQTWLSDLCEVRDNLGDAAQLQSMKRKQVPEDWERWIFSESVRRTIVMAYSVMALYELMKDPKSKDGTDPWAYSHRWTLSRYLWDSDSSSEFDRMWNEKPHFIITNYAFDDFLMYGSGKDVDDFAALLLSAYIGTDKTKEFISAHDTI
ncbi:hypothetical protein NA57DRAFT_33505 [Rhizodiscina lignyota]|uniref:Zn(2)-C6 fungal-type domain-containing protein n=1 Tax=Rhizodiscina lignyota TaxID=1504668 RepID=A0A9P4M9E4_9PEZI|nr:hypothetical protein NA57DRAFT_33505 [Rhizodiscina lignyota]